MHPSPLALALLVARSSLGLALPQTATTPALPSATTLTTQTIPATLPAECTYRPTSTRWHTTGCEFNCPSRLALAVDS
ncbi:hypothetical protein QBC47DRAFT_369250 [Echria macrotheca]|uniref:Uncharacterized protein n=1 Tax=Echria macrotheca TaxID=438768 RepID=A0AAJ0BPS7_9PEZI|nr:hypothetical protein QBC47DRAFT_369250 [Echria macrotheca]